MDSNFGRIEALAQVREYLTGQAGTNGCTASWGFVEVGGNRYRIGFCLAEHNPPEARIRELEQDARQHRHWASEMLDECSRLRNNLAVARAERDRAQELLLDPDRQEWLRGRLAALDDEAKMLRSMLGGEGTAKNKAQNR